MRISHAGHFLVLTVALAGAWWACDGGTSKDKPAAQGAAARPSGDLAQQVAGTREAAPGAAHAVNVKDTAEPEVPSKAASAGRALLVLGDSRTGFASNAVWLTPNAKAKIDAMFTSANKVALLAAHFEIEGHTDNTGTAEANRRVGLARAEAVKRYLCERYEIPEDCITVVSYGPDQPLGDNDTEDGRALNRRVVIKILD